MGYAMPSAVRRSRGGFQWHVLLDVTVGRASSTRRYRVNTRRWGPLATCSRLFPANHSPTATLFDGRTLSILFHAPLSLCFFSPSVNHEHTNTHSLSLALSLRGDEFVWASDTLSRDRGALESWECGLATRGQTLSSPCIYGPCSAEKISKKGYPPLTKVIPNPRRKSVGERGS